MIRILFLAANPLDTNRLRLDEEMRAIDHALRQGDYRDQFDIRSHWAVRISDLQELLLRHQPDIVHFSGHGSNSSEIILQDEQGNAVLVSTEALSNLFRLLKDNIRCVVLNSCYSQRQAAGIAEHVECVVGLSDEISDSAAVAFVSAFYRALGYGRSVQMAFELGQTQIDLSNLRQQQALTLIAPRTEPTQIFLVGAERVLEDEATGSLASPDDATADPATTAAKTNSKSAAVRLFDRISKFLAEYVAILATFWVLLEILIYFREPTLGESIRNWNNGTGLWLFLLGAFLLALFRNGISRAEFGSLISRLYSARFGEGKTVNTFLAEFLTRASENVPMQFIAALLPALFITGWAIGVTVVNLFTSAPFLIFSTAAVIWIGIAWTITGVLGILWFLDHKQRWQIRMTGVSNLMERYDYDIHYLLAKHLDFDSFSEADRNELNGLIYKAIDDILEGLKDVVAYRFSRETKEATFIVLRDYFGDDEPFPYGDFELFAPIHDREIDAKVRLLERKSSLAGLALDEDRVVTITDCRSPATSERWQVVPNDTKFIGRAAAPVVIFNKERQVRQEIGVLCFDIMVKWNPAAEEEDILETASDRIADLWVLYQRTNRASAMGDWA